MTFKPGDHVQVIATDHPHYGELGVILDSVTVYYAAGAVVYWFVDIGVDTISCTADQLSESMPKDAAFPGLDRLIYQPESPRDEYLEYLDLVRIRNRRRLDIVDSAGYDYEWLDLPPINHAIDGGE